MAGEQATARALAELPTGWVVIHDASWPGRRLANIDHVAVGPSGIFAIDSRDWSGRITIGDDLLHQDGRSRASTVRGAAASATAVAERLPNVPSSLVHAALCFTGSGAPRGLVGEVLVCSTRDVAGLLTSGPTVLSPEQVHAAAEELRISPQPATEPPRKRAGSRRMTRSARARNSR